MPTLFAHLAHLQPWYEAHIAPVHVPTYARDWPQVQAVLAEARAAAAAEDFSPDELQALELEIAMHRLTAMNRICSEQDYQAYFKEVIAQVLQPAAGPLAARARAVHQIHLLGAGYRRGLFDLTPAQVDALLDIITLEEMTNHVWYYLTAWAFHAGHPKYLELAFGEQMVHTTGYLDDYFWLRTNLMYLIADGRVARTDVLETIERYPHPLYLSDFEILFFPRLEPLGLVDDAIRAAVERRRAQLSHLDGSVPQQEARTRRVVR